MKTLMSLRINGEERDVLAPPHKTLLEVLREELNLTGTKHGCELGECGTWMARGGDLHPLQRAFAELGAAQCGYCTPGILLTAEALLEETPTPTRDEIKHALAGNLCRCTGYTKILDAVELAALRIKGSRP